MKIYLKIIGLVVIIVGCLQSCEKDDSELSDFRNKYIGKYFVHESIVKYGAPPPWCPYNDDDSEKDTVISVTYGGADNTLFALGHEFWLDSIGEFSIFPLKFRFRNDSIYSSYRNGGLGCGYYETYEGVRISSEP